VDDFCAAPLRNLHGPVHRGCLRAVYRLTPSRPSRLVARQVSRQRQPPVPDETRLGAIIPESCSPAVANPLHVRIALRTRAADQRAQRGNEGSRRTSWPSPSPLQNLRSLRDGGSFPYESRSRISPSRRCMTTSPSSRFATFTALFVAAVCVRCVEDARDAPSRFVANRRREELRGCIFCWAMCPPIEAL